MIIITHIPDEDNPYDTTRVKFETWEIRTDKLMELFGDFLVGCGHSKELIDDILK